MTTDNRPQARQGRNQDEARSPGAREERGGAMQRSGPQERQGQRYNVARREGQGFPSLSGPGPFLLMRRMEQEMDRLLEQLGRGGPSRGMGGAASLWMPEVETYQRDGKLHICADLPGMKKDDIQVDVDNDMMTIQGERRCEYEDDDQGFYRSERSYGSFYRTIPLPEGVNTDSCDATFRDGVLHVTFEAPQQQRRGRSVDIQDSPQRSESTSDSGGRK